MAEKETKNKPKVLTEATPEELAKMEKAIEILEKKEELPVPIKELTREEQARETTLASWVPKTELGKEVKAGKIKGIDEILSSRKNFRF